MIPSDLRLPHLDPVPIWTSEVKIPERGSLTLLKGGGFVLGCPSGTWDNVRAEAAHLVKKWMDGQAGLVLPFPVDVVDQR